MSKAGRPSERAKREAKIRAGSRLSTQQTLAELLKLSDEIIALVAGVSFDARRGDSAAFVMMGAYVRAYRRFSAITQLARVGAGDEVAILTRSLVSILARATWLDSPGDLSKRRERWRSYKRQSLKDSISILEDGARFGMPVEPREIEDLKTELATYDADGFPKDRQLLESLKLDVFYHRVYRHSSDFVHFALGVAVNELDAAEVDLARGDPQVVIDGLMFAILVYGQFLDAAERSVQHGLGAQIEALVKACPVFADQS
jgi:hypothetical protein